MPSRRCSTCSLNWPFLLSFKRCPVCKMKTFAASNIQAMSQAEAERRTKQANFERYYALHELKREGPSPEEQGAAEARELLELDRLAS